MKDLIDLLPQNHFGSLSTKTLNYLKVGESVCVYEMPESGLKHFLRMTKKQLDETKEFETLFFECQAYPIDFLTVVRNRFKEYSKEDIFQWFLGNRKYRFVVILSHVEFLITSGQTEVLEFLLKLRNLNPQALVLLSGTNYMIKTRLEDFYKAGGVFFGSILKVPLFDYEGVRRILLTNKLHFGFNYVEEDFRKIFELSGGHPGLVKHLGKCVDDWGREVLNKLVVLIGYPSITIKLRELASVIMTQDKVVLNDLGMINKEGEIFSPLLKTYLQSYRAENVDELLPNLTVQETKIFSYFLANKDVFVDKDKIAFLMGLSDENFSLWAVYKAISRLKSRLPKTYQLKVMKNKGYLLRVE